MPGVVRSGIWTAGGPRGFDFQSLPGVLFDPRTSTHRAQGRWYRAIVEQLVRSKQPYTDTARGWENKPTGWKLNRERTPRKYQLDALKQWTEGGRRGVVVMPTGTGKTFTAFLCVEQLGRPWSPRDRGSLRPGRNASSTGDDAAGRSVDDRPGQLLHSGEACVHVSPPMPCGRMPPARRPARSARSSRTANPEGRWREAIDPSRSGCHWR